MIGIDKLLFLEVAVFQNKSFIEYGTSFRGNVYKSALLLITGWGQHSNH